MSQKTEALKRAQKKYLSGRGRVSIVADPALIAAARAAAAVAGVSLSSWAAAAIAEKLEREKPRPPAADP